MKLLSLEQGSPEWIEWRKTVITATDSAVILGESPYKTAYCLYMQKKGLYAPDEINDRMLKGQLLESEARMCYEMEVAQLMNPAVVVHDDLNFLAASLDGLSEDMTRAVEIKCPGKKTHSIAKKGKIPDIYIWQLQHQMLVTGLPFIDYFSYDGQGVVVRLDRDEEKISRIKAAAISFYEGLVHNVPPAKTALDIENEKAREDADDFLSRYE